MNINLKECVRIHNRYELELKDSYTGKVKQRAVAENVVLNTIWNNLTIRDGYVLMFGGVAMGTGNGTPAESDTGLFAQAFSYSSNAVGSSALFSMVAFEESYPTSRYTWTITIPASSAYVGELTEVGLV